MGFTINNYGPSTQIDNHDGGVININNGTMENETNNCLPTAFTQDQGLKLCEFLLNGGFIPQETDRESFLFVFGCIKSKPASFKPVQWLKTMEQLRETLMQAYRPLITSKSITKAELEKTVPYCFLNKKGEEASLPKHKEETSFEIDSIRNFFSTF